MPTDTFKASVQYGDWKGTAAVDDADRVDMREWLKAKGFSRDGEFLIGVEMWAGESHGVHKDPVAVTFFFASAGNYETVKAMLDSEAQPYLRCVRVEMPVLEFLGLFKRVSIAVSAHGMLDGKEYSYPST